MSRLVMWNLITLDGFIEGAVSWDLGWHELVWWSSAARSSVRG